MALSVILLLAESSTGILPVTSAFYLCKPKLTSFVFIYVHSWSDPEPESNTSLAVSSPLCAVVNFPSNSNIATTFSILHYE